MKCRVSSLNLTRTNSWVSSATSPHIIRLSPLAGAPHARQEMWYLLSKLESQGVNAGLMLLQLDKMRESEEYNEELLPDAMSRLSGKFLPEPEWSLAAQDWFSLLSWSKPHLVARLPCQYNVMTCNTTTFSKAATFSNIPCSQETAIKHRCGINI